jgi:hypothetical protein
VAVPFASLYCMVVRYASWNYYVLLRFEVFMQVEMINPSLVTNCSLLELRELWWRQMRSPKCLKSSRSQLMQLVVLEDFIPLFDSTYRAESVIYVECIYFVSIKINGSERSVYRWSLPNAGVKFLFMSTMFNRHKNPWAKCHMMSFIYSYWM